MKVIALALNPAIDRAVYCAGVEVGALNRATAPAVTSVGGKGITNALVFRSLGVDVTCLGFWGGNNGDIILEQLRREGVDFNADYTRCETRMNIKIISERDGPTEFNESGGPILPEERGRMLDRIKSGLAGGVDLFIMGGSVPGGIEKSFYRDILNLGGGAKFILDCDGEALKLCMANGRKPDIIKPNLFELEEFCGERFELGDWRGLERVRRAVKKIYDETGVTVLCTLGEHGALYCGGDVYYARAPEVEVKGFAGAGDTFLSAFCAVYFGLYNLGDNGAECALRFAVAASAAKIRKPGTELAVVGEIFELYDKML